MFVGVVWLPGVAGMLVSGGKLDQVCTATVEPQPECAAAGRGVRAKPPSGTTAAAEATAVP